MLEKVLLTLAAIIAVFLIVVALQLSEFQVERTATMAAPPAAVFDQVNDFHKWDPTELNRQGPDTGKISLGDIPNECGTGDRRQGLYRSARSSARVRCSDRHQDRARTKFLSGRRLSSGFSSEESALALHRHQRHPKVQALKHLYPDLYRPDPVLVSAGAPSN